MLDYKSNIINNQSLMFPVKWWSFSIENMLLQKQSVIPTHFAVVRYQNKNHSIRIKTHLLFKSITSLAGPAPSCLDLTISIRPGWNYFLNKIKWFTLSDSTIHLSCPQSQPHWFPPHVQTESGKLRREQINLMDGSLEATSGQLWSGGCELGKL